MPRSTFEWQLSEITPGSEVVVKDAAGHLVARGILREDGRSLMSANGELIPLEGHPDWQVLAIKERRR